MMITLKEAMDKAGISSGMFQSDDYQIFNQFPLREKWKEKHQSVGESFCTHYKYQREFRSEPLNNWKEKQNPEIISFLKMSAKNKVYVVPYTKCCKYLDAWIAYDTKYCKFILRLNPTRLGAPAHGSLAKRIIKAAELGITQDPSITMAELISMIPDSKMPNVFKKMFGNTIVPVESFDPVSCMNQIVSSNMVTIESEGKISPKTEEQFNTIFEAVSRELHVYKMNLTNIVLFAKCTRLNLLDPYHLLEKDKEVWANLICFKFTNGTKFMIM